MWNSPIPEERWRGFRRRNRNTAAFESAEKFEDACLSELEESLQDHERVALARLLKRGQKPEIDVYVRTHGANPLFDPSATASIPVDMAEADAHSLQDSASPEANQAILNGDVVHVLFQAGEATRFQSGPFYTLSPFEAAQKIKSDPSTTPELEQAVAPLLREIETVSAALSKPSRDLLLNEGLGPKQPFLLRAALRRVVQDEIDAGRVSLSNASSVYERALKAQKILFFVSQRGGVNETHDLALRQRYAFFGFQPENVVTIEQELIRGITIDEAGNALLIQDDWGKDAAGHLYALIQSARTGAFTTYTESGRPIKPRELDALAYLGARGAKIFSVIRINDMDRHTTEIINAKALTYALGIFARGFVNAIETVANPQKQKGGTGLSFRRDGIHVLTESHEDSFPAMSRVVEEAMQRYAHEHEGLHPAYNAMRQWADLSATRQVLRDFGGRIVFVSRQKEVNGQTVSYLGADMPMGDLSLLFGGYKSRMFQFDDAQGRELLIHDMKTQENLPMALETILCQLRDPHVLTAAEEINSKKNLPFKKSVPRPLYAAPTPEFSAVPTKA